MTFDELFLVGLLAWCLTVPIVLAAHFAYRMMYDRDRNDKDKRDM